MSHLSLSKAIVALVALSLATSALFMIWPQLDIFVTSFFFQNGGFPAGQAAWVSALRYAIWDASLVMATLALGSVLLGYALKWQVLGLPLRLWNVIWWGFALGPGVLVNIILKGYSGRARPRDTSLFGGDKTFTPMGQLADQCPTDCSFVSGEVSGTTATVIAILIILLFHRHRLPSALVWGVSAIGLGMWCFVLWHRIATGGHFASDAAMAVWLTALIFALLAWALPRPR